MAFDISVGNVRVANRYLKLGRLFEVAFTAHDFSRPFAFCRPDDEFDAYYVFWRQWEITWEFPVLTARRKRLAHTAA